MNIDYYSKYIKYKHKYDGKREITESYQKEKSKEIY